MTDLEPIISVWTVICLMDTWTSSGRWALAASVSDHLILRRFISRARLASYIDGPPILRGDQILLR
jgi:hypothetical protein